MALITSESQLPDLLISRRLLSPIEKGLAQLADLHDEIRGLKENSILLQGAAVLAVSAVETAILEALREYYTAKPEVVIKDKFEVEASDLLAVSSIRDFVQRRIDLRLRKLGFEPFHQQIRRFTKVLNISEPPTPVVIGFREFKETRNMIAHGDLRVTEDYVARAAAAARSNSLGSRLPVTSDYVASGVANARDLLEHLHSQITMHYAAFTKVAAIKRLWSWLFTSSVLSFESYWVVDAGRDEIVAFNDAGFALSGSEQVILGLWMAHFNQGRPEKAPCMYSFDRENRRKVLYFLSVAHEFRLY